MSEFCPLCKKTKPEQKVFCDDCKTKLEKEYEINVPESKTNDSSLPKTAENETVSEMKEKITTTEQIASFPTDNNKKTRQKQLLFSLIIAVLAIGCFFIYKGIIRKSNLDLSKWEWAIRENTTIAFLSYMEEYPEGKYYSDAEKKVMELKENEKLGYQKVQVSENTAELRDFITANAQSPYIPLVRKKLDSLTWIATVKDNTAESYSNYMVLSQSGEFEGDYFSNAKDRYDLLFQSYPVSKNELDSVKLVVDGFFNALSTVKTDKISNYLSEKVFSFFNSKGGTKEKIIGDLIVAGSKKQQPTIKFNPNINALAYEKTVIEHFKVNVPIQKIFSNKEGKTKTVEGYIVKMELNRYYKIILINEIKPYPDAP